MCGIFGIVTKTEQSFGRLLIEVGNRLSYRGYDSVNCATIHTEFIYGPLSTVTNYFPVIFIAGSHDISLILSSVNETTCRGGFTIVVGPNDARLRSNANQMITLPDTDPYMAALLAILPLQNLSYKLSLALGYNPEFPRNLR